MSWIKHTFAIGLLMVMCYILWYSYSYPEQIAYFPTELDQEFSTLENKYDIPVGKENIKVKDHNVFMYYIFLHKLKITIMFILSAIIYLCLPLCTIRPFKLKKKFGF